VIVTSKIPVFFLLHPVGIGATRPMNVLSAKLWLRALVDLLPDVVISAPWLPYAEAMIERERGLRDAFVCAERCDGCVATGGEFSRGTTDEWDLFGRLGRMRIDLTKSPMPDVLSYETFAATRTASFQQAVTAAFRNSTMMRAVA
jgi:hypothetical protein